MKCISGSLATEKLTYLLNDAFDVLNGRRRNEAIDHSNWLTKIVDGKKVRGKKEILKTFIEIIDMTIEMDRIAQNERRLKLAALKKRKIADERKKKPFKSDENSGENQVFFDVDIDDVDEQSILHNENDQTAVPRVRATFASKTTLEGWRLTLSSTIDLTEELLHPTNAEEKYDFVLSAKWNQDALEVQCCCSINFLDQ